MSMFFNQNKRKKVHEIENRVHITEGLVGKDTNMAAVPLTLLGDISMAAVTSRENSL